MRLTFQQIKKIRFSSIIADTPPIYWSICFNDPISIINYTFTEPNYGIDYCHQKSWDFYGATSKNAIWNLIDSQRDRYEHNSPNYIGNYSVNNSGPFQCFKFEAIEANYTSLTLTFRRFDIFVYSYFFKFIVTKYVIFDKFHLVTPFIPLIYS